MAGHAIAHLDEIEEFLASTERRAESTTTSESRGAGLGLSIVRSVAHAHGGDVEATPREHGGLTVRVRLPTAPERPSEPSNANSA